MMVGDDSKQYYSVVAWLVSCWNRKSRLSGPRTSKGPSSAGAPVSCNNIDKATSYSMAVTYK